MSAEHSTGPAGLTAAVTAPERIVAEFRLRFRRQLALLVVVIPAVVVLVLASRAKMGDIAGIPMSDILPFVLVALFGGAAFSFWNWRCPACRSYLGKALYPRHCSGCGARLHD